MIKNCNKKLQGLEECFAGSMQMVHLKKGFHKSGYIKWSRSDRVEKKWQLYIMYREYSTDIQNTQKEYKRVHGVNAVSTGIFSLDRRKEGKSPFSHFILQFKR